MPKRDWLMGVKQGVEILNNHLPEYRMAIVNLNPGETSEAAWNRHLAQNPVDIEANIRVFNRFPVLDKTN